MKTWWRCSSNSLILYTIASHFPIINLCQLWKSSPNSWGFPFSINYLPTIRKEIQNLRRLPKHYTCNNLISRLIGKQGVVSKVSLSSSCLRKLKIFGTPWTYKILRKLWSFSYMGWFCFQILISLYMWTLSRFSYLGILCLHCLGISSTHFTHEQWGKEVFSSVVLLF